MIAEDYAHYHDHMDMKKVIPNNFYVIKEKQNHSRSYAGAITVSCEIPFGNTQLQCEIREASSYNYSFSYITDCVDDRVLSRLDVGNGTHRNRAPGIPLELTSVPTPHYHYYRDDGYFLAYPLDGINYSGEESIKFDFNKGYSYLCDRLKFQGSESGILSFNFCPEGIIPLMDVMNDPNENISFTEID